MPEGGSGRTSEGWEGWRGCRRVVIAWTLFYGRGLVGGWKGEGSKGRGRVPVKGSSQDEIVVY
jgi:hypothetical protein